MYTNLNNNSEKWLVTGVAGFIGSNLLEFLLQNNQIVIGIDNFSTGNKRNLLQVKDTVTHDEWKNFKFHDGDICDYDLCFKTTMKVDYVLHQAALGSVPRSIKDPISSNRSNISGFLNMIMASKENKVKRFVYAASSSTYGDHPDLPKVENKIGNPLSPYAITKYVNELYSNIFSSTYGFHSIGLRYFNVFGKRQDPDGAYAAVIPKWINAMMKGEEISIYGDGLTSRDFCYVDNAVQANILAAMSNISQSEIFNVAYGGNTNLNELYAKIRENLERNHINYELRPVYKDFRDGDVRHSQADISKAKNLLGYAPKYNIDQGLKEVMQWHINSPDS